MTKFLKWFFVKHYSNVIFCIYDIFEISAIFSARPFFAQQLKHGKTWISLKWVNIFSWIFYHKGTIYWQKYCPKKELQNYNTKENTGSNSFLQKMPNWTSLIKVFCLTSDFKSMDIFEISWVDLVNKILISGQKSTKIFSILFSYRADDFVLLEQMVGWTENGRPTKNYFW